jgi:hypothetical protein
MDASRTTATGVAAWRSEAWRADALAWLDERLAAAGIERTGPVDRDRVRPWATVLRVPTTAGPVWLKAAGPGTAAEVGLYRVLAATVADRVLAPIAADTDRAWLVLPDGGPALAERAEGDAQVEGLVAALPVYGQLQRDLAPATGDLLAAGVADMRPAVMVERFDEAVAVTAAAAEAGTDEDRAAHRRAAGMRATVGDWCRRLDDSALPASLDHNDLHPGNVLGPDGDPRFYDWGDSVVAHPFAAMLVALGYVRHLVGPADARFDRARRAYLDGFGPLAPGEDLGATLELACRLAKIARTLTWARAVGAAVEQGEEVHPDWAAAPLATLTALADDDWLGGA